MTIAKSYARIRDEQFSIYEKYARQHGLNGKSLLVLMWIYYDFDHLTQENIAKRIHSTKQVIQAIVKNYLEEGLVILERCTNDRRKKYVRLTEKGLQLAHKVLDPLEKYEAMAMAQLTIQQQNALLETTRLFSDKLSELLAKHKVLL